MEQGRNGAARPHRIMRLPAVMEATGLGSTSIYELIKENKFPKAVPLTGRAVGWLESEVLEWQQARIAARETKEAA
jgi:prophage regulatory protein